MKIFNISVKELLKNKLYFSYFAAGLALILAVICVLANYSKQIFDGFFTQFNDGDVLPLEMRALPSEPKAYEKLPVFARGRGVTYDITISHGESSVFLPSYKGGLCVVSLGEDFMPRELFPVFVLGDAYLKEGRIYLSMELADELVCEPGDTLDVGGKEYSVRIIPLHTDTYSFVIFDPQTRADEITLILPDAEKLLDITEYLTPENFTDKDGLLALCDGYRGLKTGMGIVMTVLSAVCALYIFIFIRMYLAKRGEFVRTLYRVGMGKGRLLGCLGAVFAALCFIGSAAGFLISVLLDMLVDKWADELLEMHVDEVNYAAYFAVCFAACALASAVSLLLNMPSEKEVSNR